MVFAGCLSKGPSAPNGHRRWACRGLQFEYLTLVTNPALFGHENFMPSTSTRHSSAATASASLKINPVACSTRTDSGSPVTGFLMGAVAADMKEPTLTLLVRPLRLKVNGT